MNQSHLTQNLKELRALARLSQNELSNSILQEFGYDLPRQNYAAYEEGRNEPNLSTLAILAKFYGCSIEDLISDQSIISKEEERLVADSLGLQLQLAAIEKEYHESRFKVIQDQYKMLKHYYISLLELYSNKNKEILVEAPNAKEEDIIFVSLEHSFSDSEIYLITNEINLLNVIITYMRRLLFPNRKLNPNSIKIMEACEE